MENIIVNVENEFMKLNSKTINEYSSVIGDLDFNNIKILNFEDENKTVNFLFYGSDFFAYNRVNFKNDYEYNKGKDYIEISENLNTKIQKIPNVAKTRGILKIDDIEARIYDMGEYILLLTRDETRILKVKAEGDISDITYTKPEVQIDKIKENIDLLILEEEARLKEERSFKNKIKRIKIKITNYVSEPIRFIRQKLFKTSEIKMLSEGKHSIFDK
ncbi:MAG: hypothetical protein IKF52_01490 [Clostridia bacterium]|nr:hypothetical protein [Clostridia bacterium]MBR3152183.1 hypothetical protein [Clostridia bacterium]MBR3152280.1 hypothetical protein [Clostridia bacterium]